MIMTIHQPEHLPWLGFFNKIAKAELYVILDSVQFEKNYFQNRNRILGTNGIQWLGIPISISGHMNDTIANTKISSVDKKWRAKYLKTIEMSYGKHPFFDEVYQIIAKCINIDTELLCDINIEMIKAFFDKLDIECKVIRSTSLNVGGLKSDLILEICKAVEADTYIAGPSGRDYLKVKDFEDSGIKITFNDFTHPKYEQRKSKEFVSHLSGVDLFMNVGFDEGKRIIMNGNEGLSDA